MSWRIKKIIILHALAGFICWYSIEKVFQRSIGISVFQIAIMAVIYILTSVLLNVPTGIFADKFGRKYALFLAAVALLASTIVAGTAHSFAQYTFAVFLWGLFYTTQNGAFEAILYDSLKEEGRAKNYARYSSISNAGFWLSIFVSSLVGAYVGSKFGLRYAYLITVIPNLFAIGLSLALQEPKNHTSKEKTSPIRLVREGFKAISSSRKMIYLSAVYLVILMVGWSTNEFGQLFFIELGFSVLGVGVLTAFSGLSQAAGNYFGYKFGNISNRKIIITLFVLFSLTFALPTKFSILATGIFMVLVFLRHTFYISNNTQIQHSLPSEVRATSISALGMINDAILAISFLSFGYLSQRSNVRVGYFVFVIYAALILFTATWLARRTTKEKRSEQNASPIIDEGDSYPR